MSPPQLRDVLSRLYDDPRKIRRVLDDAGLPTHSIDLRGPVRDIWHDALKEAERQDKVSAIEGIARHEYPTAFPGDAAPVDASTLSRPLSPADAARMVAIALRHRADRDLLLAWLDDRVVGHLPRKSTPYDQLNSDVQTLARLEGAEERPIITWLKNLRDRVRPFPELAEVDRLINHLGE